MSEIGARREQAAAFSAQAVAVIGVYNGDGHSHRHSVAGLAEAPGRHTRVCGAGELGRRAAAGLGRVGRSTGLCGPMRRRCRDCSLSDHGGGGSMPS